MSYYIRAGFSKELSSHLGSVTNRRIFKRTWTCWVILAAELKSFEYPAKLLGCLLLQAKPS